MQQKYFISCHFLQVLVVNICSSGGWAKFKTSTKMLWAQETFDQAGK